MERNQMKSYADKYFLRSNEVLKAEGINPWVNMQVFARHGPGKVNGMREAIDLIMENSHLRDVGGRIYAKQEGDNYLPSETLMNIVAPAQEIMELESIYLGVITSALTRENDKKDLDFNYIGSQIREVVELAGDRPVLHFGSRHWHWTYDCALANLAFENGVRDVATDNGAIPRGKLGVGTIPHALENIFAYSHGKDNAVLEATKAFDRTIPENVPRIALVDYNNKEITDALATARGLDGMLSAIRTDTCGENLSEGALEGDRKYWEGNGVTVSGVYALRTALNEGGFEDVGIYLSSGFSNPEKVKAFNEGEKFYGTKLYDGIGAGFLDGVRCATADIVAIGEYADSVDFYSQEKVQDKNIVHKVGRPPRPNKSLERIV